MALREKLAERCAAFLEPGEQIQAVFMAQSGPSPYWVLLSAWITILGNNYVVIVVTDRAVVIRRAGRFTPSKPKSLLLRGARAVQFGPQSGLWGQIQLDKRYWVHRRFHKDLAEADAALGTTAPGPVGQP